jgi:hypothetical protein
VPRPSARSTRRPAARVRTGRIAISASDSGDHVERHAPETTAQPSSEQRHPERELGLGAHRSSVTVETSRGSGRTTQRKSSSWDPHAALFPCSRACSRRRSPAQCAMRAEVRPEYLVTVRCLEGQTAVRHRRFRCTARAFFAPGSSR